MNMALGQAKRRERAALEWTKKNSISSASSASVSGATVSSRPFSPVHTRGSCFVPTNVIGANAKDGRSLPSLLPSLQVGSNQVAAQIGRSGFRSRSAQRMSLTSQSSQPTRASSPWVMPPRERFSLRRQIGFQQQNNSPGGLASLRGSSSPHSRYSQLRPQCTLLHRSTESRAATTTMMAPVAASQWEDTSCKGMFSPSPSTPAMTVNVAHSARGWVVTDNLQQSTETVQSLPCPRRQHPSANIFQKCSSEVPFRAQVQPQMVVSAQ